MMRQVARQSLTLNLSLMSDASDASVHPEIWALTALLEAAGLDASAGGPGTAAAVALGVSGGAGLLTIAFYDRRADRSTLHLTGWNPFQTSLLGGLERLGVPAVVRETSRRRRAARYLDEALAGGTPAAVWVDGATLGFAPEALRGMSPTVVVARAAADAQGEIAVSDGRTERTVARAHLDEAREANPAHRARVVTLGTGTLDPVDVMARRGLATTAVGPLGGPGGAHGAKGLRAFAELLATPAERAEVFPGDAGAATALAGLHRAVTGEHGLLRRHQAAFVEHAAAVGAIDAADGVVLGYRALADDWDALAAGAQPAEAEAAGEADARFAALAARLSALADAEDEALEVLRAVLRPG